MMGSLFVLGNRGRQHMTRMDAVRGDRSGVMHGGAGAGEGGSGLLAFAEAGRWRQGSRQRRL